MSPSGDPDFPRRRFDQATRPPAVLRQSAAGDFWVAASPILGKQVICKTVELRYAGAKLLFDIGSFVIATFLEFIGHCSSQILYENCP
jgi:hypothetical protein